MKNSVKLITIFTGLILIGSFAGVYAQYDAPTGFVVQSGTPYCVELSWNAHWFEGYNDPYFGWYTRYTIQRLNKRKWEHVAYTQTYNYSDCGLAVGSEACYHIRAELYYDGYWYYTLWTDPEQCAFPGIASPPAPPINFVVQTGDSAAIDLSWDDTSGLHEWYEIHRDGYQIEADYVARLYTDFPLEPGASHCYKVMSCNTVGCSDFTSELCDTAGNPYEAPPGPGQMPTSYPPFLSESVPANVLIVFDNSGSMNYCAYYGSYQAGRDYYGYAEPDIYYVYNSATITFEPTNTWTGQADPLHDRFSGAFLNWLTMKRVDIARKALVGGKVEDRSISGPKILLGEPTDQPAVRQFYKYHLLKNIAGQTIKWEFLVYGDDVGYYQDYIFVIDPKTLEIDTVGQNWVWRDIAIRGPEEPTGIIQQVSDRLELGLMFYNGQSGGYVADYLGSPDEHIISEIENTTPMTTTPIGETFYEACRYYQATTSYYNAGTDYSGDDPCPNGCEKCFVILMSDGEPTNDEMIPDSLKGYDSYTPDAVPDTFPENGTDYLRDLALWAHVSDLRPTDYPEWTNNITTYVIYSFGAMSDDAIELLNRTARNGGFSDDNGNKIPDLQAEWDSDGDGYADGFHFASSGEALENAFQEVFLDILERLDASSAVSVVTNSIKGEGNAFQAVFSPKKLFGLTMLRWVGNVQALWIDQMGNLREDTDNDTYLDMDDDYIVRIYFNGENTIGERYEDTDADGIADNYVNEVDIDNIEFVWNAGEMLYNRSASTRNIKAVIPDTASFAAVGSPKYKLLNFTVDNASNLNDYLNVNTVAEAGSIIAYLRGVDFPNYRSRTYNGKVWKLSDIVNCRPVYVADPRERYDLLYNDETYMNYYMDTKDREGVLFIGGNDGILKAFNAGTYVETGNNISPGRLDGGGTSLGAELWGIIPYNLLPHLKWLTLPTYTHVYFIDLKLKATDAKIFTDDGTHKGGWGTILICGQNFGGYPTTNLAGDTVNSSYMAIDITDPANYSLLWFFSDEDLGFTTTYPAIAKIDSTWLLLIGSGPTKFDGTSDKKANLFVIDLQTGTTLLKYEFTESNACLGDPITVDVDMDYTTDLAYVGLSNYSSNPGWKGKMYRLNFNNSTDPADWTVTTLMDVERPIQAAGGVTMDYYGNLWVLFGTGRYTSDFDEKDSTSQYFVAVKDKYWSTGSGSISKADLYDVSSCQVYETDTGYVVKGTASGEQMFSQFLNSVNQADGWISTFSNGERITTEPAILGETVFFTTIKPNLDVCAFGGEGRLFGVYYMSGTPEPTNQTLGKNTVSDETILTASISLGEGVPTAPTAHIGMTDEATISIQMSTGEIKQAQAKIAGQKSAAIFWKGR
ncbi:hypothetical protein JXI42_14445 [bacterium]|nr:hypothetical protein [bacterium]